MRSVRRTLIPSEPLGIIFKEAGHVGVRHERPSRVSEGGRHLIRGIEGKEQELEAHLLSLSAPTRAEAGCVSYDLYHSASVENHFMRLEVWASPSSLEAHKATHIRSSFEKRQREGWSTEITVWKRVG